MFFFACSQSSQVIPPPFKTSPLTAEIYLPNFHLGYSATPLFVIFSQPMPAHNPLQIHPRISGKFEWINRQIGVFTPNKNWPEASRVTISIPQTTQSMWGRILTKEIQKQFQTPSLSLEKMITQRSDDGFWNIAFLWNQPVLATHLAERLQISEAGEHLDFQCQSQASLWVVCHLPIVDSQSVFIKISPLLKGSSGNLPLGSPIEKQINLLESECKTNCFGIETQAHPISFDKKFGDLKLPTLPKQLFSSEDGLGLGYYFNLRKQQRPFDFFVDVPGFVRQGDLIFVRLQLENLSNHSKPYHILVSSTHAQSQKSQEIEGELGGGALKNVTLPFEVWGTSEVKLFFKVQLGAHDFDREYEIPIIVPPQKNADNHATIMGVTKTFALEKIKPESDYISTPVRLTISPSQIIWGHREFLDLVSSSPRVLSETLAQIHALAALPDFFKIFDESKKWKTQLENRAIELVSDLELQTNEAGGVYFWPTLDEPSPILTSKALETYTDLMEVMDFDSNIKSRLQDLMDDWRSYLKNQTWDEPELSERLRGASMLEELFQKSKHSAPVNPEVVNPLIRKLYDSYLGTINFEESLNVLEVLQNWDAQFNPQSFRGMIQSGRQVLLEGRFESPLQAYSQEVSLNKEKENTFIFQSEDQNSLFYTLEGIPQKKALKVIPPEQIGIWKSISSKQNSHALTVELYIIVLETLENGILEEFLPPGSTLKGLEKPENFAEPVFHEGRFQFLVSKLEPGVYKLHYELYTPFAGKFQVPGPQWIGLNQKSTSWAGKLIEMTIKP